MTWIETVPFDRAEGKLRKLYERVAGPDGRVDQILAAHSLRPHSLEGHMALYKNVLHHGGNRLPKSLLETVGVWVSHLNRCAYCFEHHLAGLGRLLGDEGEAKRVGDALARGDLARFDARTRAALHYAEALTRAPGQVGEEQLEALRSAGCTDGEILEINQVTSYFAYANRTVLGLGVSTEGEVLGLSPGNAEDPDDWGHR